MKTVWIASIAMAAAMPTAFAQTTIYKHVDDSGRVTYSNKPMKGAAVMDLEPLTTIPGTPAGRLQKTSVAAVEAADAKAEAKADGKFEARAELKADVADTEPRLKPAAAIVTALPRERLASIEPQVQGKRDRERRKILEQELSREEESLSGARTALLQEQQNPVLIAAVRVAQQAAEPTASQLAEFRSNIDKASGRIRGLQATVAEHEKNIEALKKELGAVKP
jgi:chromosome segregation ATPase